MSAREEAVLRFEARREAAPAVAVALGLLCLLALVSWAEEWRLLEHLGWWIWLVLAVPALVLTADLAAGARGAGLARTRRVALVLLRLLVLANLGGLAILVAGLVTTSTRNLGGGELLLTAAVIWATNVVVFGVWYWEVDAGGPAERARRGRERPDFQFPQDENPELAARGWRPQVWDYLYVSLTNAVAFSPTDAMPLSLRAKRLMGLESVLSIVTLLLVAARAVNVLGS
ncbi:MAG TPA: DUF1345 domain-containing protein [Gaiellaceae bacterium]|nr:DUF1345 domain-containing protein [Gaiellaceae bacterium]